jgi:hypothetical protein
MRKMLPFIYLFIFYVSQQNTAAPESCKPSSSFARAHTRLPPSPRAHSFRTAQRPSAAHSFSRPSTGNLYLPIYMSFALITQSVLHQITRGEARWDRDDTFVRSVPHTQPFLAALKSRFRCSCPVPTFPPGRCRLPFDQFFSVSHRKTRVETVYHHQHPLTKPSHRYNSSNHASANNDEAEDARDAQL